MVSRNVRCQRMAPLAALMAYRESFSRGDKNDRIVGAGRADRVRAGGDGDVGQNQRLGIDLAVQWGVVQLAEIGGVDVRRRQLRLGQVGPGRLGINVVLRDIRREQATILESLQKRPRQGGRLRLGPEVVGTAPSRFPHVLCLTMNPAGELSIEPWVENISLEGMQRLRETRFDHESVMLSGISLSHLENDRSVSRE